MSRANDDAAGLEAARLRFIREVRNTVLGTSLVGAACIVLIVSAWANHLDVWAAGTSIGLAIAGGLFMEPKTFKYVAGRALDALPGGKR